MIKAITRFRAINSFVLRTGRMTAGQQRGWHEYWHRWGLPIADQPADWTAIFQRAAPTVLEIGYGMGLSLATMAELEPSKNFVGIEVHRPGVGSLLNTINKKKLTNVRTYCGDAVTLLKQCIPDNSLAQVQIYFPDPWPKKRHHKRRLIQPAFIELIRRKLNAGGILHLATDWEDYAEHMMAVITAADCFDNLAGEYAFAERPDYRPLTKFEQRGQQLGHPVWDLLFAKRRIEEAVA